MDFNGLLVLGVVWLLFNLFGALRRGERPAPGPRPAPRPPQPGVPTHGRPVGSADATQREGSRLEQLLRELERNLEQVGGTQPAPSARVPESVSRSPGEVSGRPAQTSRRPGQSSRAPAAPLPSAEEVEDRTSLDETPIEVVSLEGEVHRPARQEVDYDGAAEAVVRRRIEAARRRDRALTKADHEAFDARIRQEPADHTAVAKRFTPAQLRDAIVWREILGPPVSEREV